MSVPLDRLYHYLTDVVNHDLVIYRWAPSGSRKLEDLTPLCNYSNHQLHNNLPLICHDQEPLNYNMYTAEQVQHEAKKIFMANTSPNWCGDAWLANNSILDYHGQHHLRGVTAMCNTYDLTMLLHSELRSQQVALYESKNFVPVYYWSHALIARDWFRYAEHDPKLNYQFDQLAKDFLIYNRAWSGTREYRLWFAEHLCKTNLLPYCQTSFSAVDQGTHYTNHAFVNQKFCINSRNLENSFAVNTADSWASADYASQDYAGAAIEVVLETLFDDDRWHLTEKTLRPLACGKPFILASTPGSLQYLRAYGFETFAEFIDESYDLVLDPKDRLTCIVKEMQRISKLNASTKKNMYTELNHIAQRNKRRFFHDLADQVINEYNTNIDHAVHVMNQQQTSKHAHAIQQLMQ